MNEELRKQIAALMRQGATDADIEAFVADYEARTKPAAPTITAGPVRALTEEDKATERAARYRDNYGMADNLLRNAAFGLGDEIRSTFGAVKDMATGAGPFGASFHGRMRAEEQGMDKFAREHPKQALASGLVGGVVTALGSGPVKATQTAGQALRGAMQTGAAYGAASGAGEARGSLWERAKGAGTGAAIGGVAGAVFQGAANRIGAWRNRPSIAERADRKIMERLGQSGQTLDDVERAAATAREAGKPFALIDAGDDAMRQLGRDATAFPTKGRERLVQFVEGRMADQPERVVGDLAATGRMTRVASSRAAIDQLAQQREELAKPLYDAIRDVQVQDPRLGELFTLPDFQKAYQAAQRVAQRRAAVGMGQPLPPLDPARPMTMGVLDQVKRALDDVSYVAKRSPLEAGGMGPTELASLRDVVARIRQIGDDATRDGTGRSLYASARAMYEGPTRLMEAIDEAASGFLNPKTTAADIQATLAKMGSAEREAFRAGALDHIANRLDNARSGRDVAALLDTPATNKKLALLFDSPEDYAAWRTRFQMERGFGETRNRVAVGSRTTPMAAGAADLAGNDDMLTAAVQSALSMSPKPLMRQGIADRLGAYRRGVGKEVADAIANRLADGGDNPDRLARIIAELRAKQLAGPRRVSVSPPVSRFVGQLFGGARY